MAGARLRVLPIGSRLLTGNSSPGRRAQGSQVLSRRLSIGGLWQMRHLIGLVLALDISAALFFGGGWGVWRITTVHEGAGLADASALASTHNLLPVLALAGTGLLLGILLAVRRISPLATGLPGLALLAWSALVLMRGSYAIRFVPLAGEHYASGFAAMLGSGAAAIIGIAMIVPLFQPSRWRRSRPADDGYDYEDIDVPAELGLVP